MPVIPPVYPVQLVGGPFEDASGNLLKNGYLRMFLNQDANIAGVGNICSGIYVQIQLDQYGNVAVTPNEQFVWGNDQMLPANCYYRVSGFTASGQLAWGPNNQQVFGNGGTFNVGTWIPNQVISWTPPVQPVTFENNGALNSSQTLLNLTSGTGITITDQGNGAIQFSGASGGTGNNVVVLPQFNGQDGGLANFTMVMKIPAALVQSIGSKVIVSAMTGSNPGGTGFEWSGASIGATLPSRYIPGVISASTAWTSGPTALTWPGGAFGSASTVYPSNPLTFTIDTNHDYYITFYLTGANTSNIPYVHFAGSAAGAVSPQWQGCFGYISGNHTADADASAIQTLSSGGDLHLFCQVTIG